MEEGLTGEDVKRMSILGGLRDQNLAEKAITEEYTLQQLTQAAINRETSKSNADAMQAKNAISINRLERTETGEAAGNYSGGDVEAQMNHLRSQMEELEMVARLQKAGRFSGRYREQERKEKCNRCTYSHTAARKCPAEGRTCDTCGETRHFTKSTLCKKAKVTGTRRKAEQRTNRVQDEDSASLSEDSDVEQVDRLHAITVRKTDTVRWPGTRGKARFQNIDRVETSKGSRNSKRTKWVQVRLGDRDMKLYCDTGSRLTIIPPGYITNRWVRSRQPNTGSGPGARGKHWMSRVCSRPPYRR